nr:hypothetical protein [Propionibacterium sp.]
MIEPAIGLSVPTVDTALQNLDRAYAELRAAQDRLGDAVLTARSAGATWAQIGDATGMSRQAAHERWGHLPRGGCRRAGCDCPHHLPHDCPCGHAGRRRREPSGAP